MSLLRREISSISTTSSAKRMVFHSALWRDANKRPIIAIQRNNILSLASGGWATNIELSLFIAPRGIGDASLAAKRSRPYHQCSSTVIIGPAQAMRRGVAKTEVQESAGIARQCRGGRMLYGIALRKITTPAMRRRGNASESPWPATAIIKRAATVSFIFLRRGGDSRFAWH